MRDFYLTCCMPLSQYQGETHEKKPGWCKTWLIDKVLGCMKWLVSKLGVIIPLDVKLGWFKQCSENWLGDVKTS